MSASSARLRYAKWQQEKISVKIIYPETIFFGERKQNSPTFAMFPLHIDKQQRTTKKCQLVASPTSFIFCFFSTLFVRSTDFCIDILSNTEHWGTHIQNTNLQIHSAHWKVYEKVISTHVSRFFVWLLLYLGTYQKMKINIIATTTINKSVNKLFSPLTYLNGC